MFTLQALLAEFLDALATEGRPAGPADLLRIQELARRLPPDTGATQLGLAVVPLFARNPAEQARLHELWLECAARVQLREEQFRQLAQPGAEATANPDSVKTRSWRRLALWAAVILASILLAVLWWYWHNNQPSPTKTPPVPPDTTATLVDTFNIRGKQPRPAAGDTLLFQPLPLPYPDSLDNLRARTVAPRTRWLAQHWPWLRWALLLPFSLLLFALWQYFEYRRRRLVARQERHRQPPYVWNIRLDDPANEQFLAGDAYAQLLLNLRRRTGADTWLLDLPASIRDTAARGGLPTLRYRQPSRPVDYLLLLDRQHAHNHRARLFEALYQALCEQEIAVARFWYDSDIRRCFDEAHPEGLALPDLQQRFAGARLAIIGTGLQLLSPVSGRPAPWVEYFHHWKERALLTPLPSAEWGLNEQRLAEHFTLLPATLQSLSFWVEELDSGQDARFDEWRNRVLDAPRAALRPVPGADPLPLLTLQFDTPLLRWIAACAIYPELHWDLTLWLGRRLSPPGLSLVGPANLLGIFRLPWFVEGRIPDDARTALIDYLSASDPGLLRTLRTEIAALLAQNEPPLTSAAWDQHRLHLVLQQWLATDDPAQRRRLEREIAQLLEGGAEADLTVLRLLRRPRPGTLDFIVPQSWKKHLFRRGLPALGWQPRWRDLARLLPCWIAAAAALLWPYAFLRPPSPCPNGQPLIWQGAGYCLSSPTDSLRWLSRLATDTIDNNRPDLAAFDTLTAQAARLEPRADSAARQHYRRNAAVALFNAGARYYARDLRDSACLCFDKTNAFDFAVLGDEYPKFTFWCAPREASVPFDRTFIPDHLPVQAAYAQIISRFGNQTNPVTQLSRFNKKIDFAAPTGSPVYAAASGKVLTAERNGGNGLFIKLNHAGLYTTEYLHLNGFVDGLKSGQTVTKGQLIGYVGSTGLATSPKLGFAVTFKGEYIDPASLLNLSAFTGETTRQPGNNAQTNSLSTAERPIEGANPRDVVNLSDGFENWLREKGLQQALQYKTVSIDNGKGSLYLGFYSENPDTVRKTWEQARQSFAARNQGAALEQALFDQFVKLSGFAREEISVQLYDTYNTQIAPCFTRIIYLDNGALKTEARDCSPQTVSAPPMKLIRGDTFSMGDQFDEGELNEKPVHSVTLSDFYLGQYEVTNAEYCVFLNEMGNREEEGAVWIDLNGSFNSEKCRIRASGSGFEVEKGYERHPVLYVNWYGARAYCAWLSRKTGQNYRLPTEAEWEYAAREGGKKVRFGNGKDIADPAEINFDGSSAYKKPYSIAGVYRQKTTPVGSLPANALGLYDMTGNVWEWCSDRYGSDYYQSSPQTNPAGPSSGSGRVVRGGSWNDYPLYCRVAVRNDDTPGNRVSSIGFRLARTL